jgi:hypothetical protein
MSSNDNAIAQLIVSALPKGSVVRLASDDENVRFRVEDGALKLRTIVLNRESLRKLESDPQRDVKIEYLQRDLVRSVMKRAEYRYPRLSRLIPAKILTIRRFFENKSDEMVVNYRHGRRAG